MFCILFKKFSTNFPIFCILFEKFSTNFPIFCILFENFNANFEMFCTLFWKFNTNFRKFKELPEVRNKDICKFLIFCRINFPIRFNVNWSLYLSYVTRVG